MMFCVVRHSHGTECATIFPQARSLRSLQVCPFPSRVGRLADELRVFNMSNTGSLGGASASDPESSSKKRRVSARQGAQGLETFIGFTQQGDMKYINEQLALGPRLVHFVASWLRDGTLHQALKKHEQQ